MNDALISGLFSLLGAIIGGFTSVLIYSKTMKKTLLLEIEKIKMQKESELSVRLLDKKEAFYFELLSALSIARNVIIDINEFGYTDETVEFLRQSKRVVDTYLNAYEKANILYVSREIRHEAAQILHAWKSYCYHAEAKLHKNSEGKIKVPIEHIHNIESLVEDIKRELGRL